MDEHSATDHLVENPGPPHSNLRKRNGPVRGGRTLFREPADELLASKDDDGGGAHDVVDCVAEGFSGSSTTINSVAIGPSERDTSHQAEPLRPFAWASPALMRAKVNQPTAYWAGIAPGCNAAIML